MGIAAAAWMYTMTLFRSFSTSLLSKMRYRRGHSTAVTGGLDADGWKKHVNVTNKRTSRAYTTVDPKGIFPSSLSPQLCMGGALLKFEGSGPFVVCTIVSCHLMSHMGRSDTTVVRLSLGEEMKPLGY